MNTLQRLNSKSLYNQSAAQTDRLALYDQYGSVAYGVILQILPQPHLAQEVLVDLFASPELITHHQAQPSNGAVAIIRLARSKALAAKAKIATAAPTFSEDSVTTTADLPQLIFDLSFCQGCTPEQIADRLQIDKSAVLMAIHTYLKNYRQSR